MTTPERSASQINSTATAGGLPSADAAPASTPEPLGWLQVLRSRLGFEAAPTLRDTLREALDDDLRTAAAFSEQEREMLSRILRFGALRVSDCMVPRADIIAIDDSETLARLLVRFTEAGVSRIPVYRETLDDPRGMIHIKDLVRWLTLKASGATPEPAVSASAVPVFPAAPALNLAAIDLSQPISSASVNRPVLFVPPSMPALNLFLRMQSTRIHLAMVVDEYGGTDGLVSIEDLVEQVMGEIEDEHDKNDPTIVQDQKQGLVALGRTPLDELEEYIGIKLADPQTAEEIDTLAGLLFKLAGRVPVRGELVPHPAGLEFEVIDADARRLKKIRVHLRKVGAVAKPAEK